MWQNGCESILNVGQIGKRMINIGVWVDRDGLEASNALNKAFKSSGCSKVIRVRSCERSEIRKLSGTLQSGDRLTVVSLNELDIDNNALIELLEELHQRGIELHCLDGLQFPTGKVGEQIIQWLAAAESMRSHLRSRSVKSGLAKAPRPRKIDESKKDSFLRDAETLSRGQLADAYEISPNTARKYLKRWRS